MSVAQVRIKERKVRQMGYMRIITPEGVTDIEEMSMEEMMGVYVELMKEDK